MSKLADEFGLGVAGGQPGSAKRSSLADEFGLQPPTPKAQGIGDTLVEGAKSTGRAVAATVSAYTGDGQGIAGRARSQQQAPRDHRLEKFHSDYAERTGALGDDPGVLETIGQGIGAVVDNPSGAGLAVLEQLPNAAVALGGGWAGMKGGAAVGAGIGSVVPGIGTAAGGVGGGILGGLAGMFLGNTALETGHKAMELAGDGEVTPEEMAQARREGAVKGGVITGVDALTLGIGGKVASTLRRTSNTALEAATRKALVDRGVDVADETAVLAARSNPEIAAAVRAAQENARKATDRLGKRAAVGGTLLGMETVGEGLGEYLGELAATGEGNVPDAVLEGLLSLGQSGAETAWNMSRTRMVQPAPTEENPMPAPVPRPDPSDGSISRAAAMLPAPDRLALPAPEPVLYADSAGQVSEQGPRRDVDREQRTVPGREAPTGGPGMDQQTPRGDLPISGEVIPAAPARQGQPPAASRTFDAEPVRAGIPDLRPEAVIVDEAGRAQMGRVPTQQPMEVPGRPDGMASQAVPGQRPRFDQVLQQARAAGPQADAAVLAEASGATRAQAARAIRGVQAEQQAISTTFKSVPGANKALRGLPEPGAFEVVKVGNREWRIQRRQEVQDADRRAGAADDGAAGNPPAAADAADNVAREPVVAERPAAARRSAESGRSGVPAAVQGADGQRALNAARDPRRVVNRDRDSVMQAVIRLGGITTQWRQDTTGEAKGNKFIPGVGALWSDKTGTGLDDMASLLDQSGYVPAGEMERDGGVSWLQQALRDEISGQQTRYAPGSARQEADLLKREAERFGFTDDADWQEVEAKLDAAFDLTEDIAELEARRAAHEARVAELDSLLGGTNERSTEEAGTVAEGGQAAFEPGSEEVGPAEGSQQSGGRDSGQGSGTGAPGDSFSLEQQTEQGLREQAAQQQAAEQAAAEAQRQAEQRTQADRDRSDFTLTGSDRPSDVAASRGQNDMFAPRTRGEARQKIEDLGEKIGGARKDSATPGAKSNRASATDERPSWARRFEISQIVSSSKVGEIGRWQIRDARSKDWMNQPRQIGGTFATREEAELAVPVIAVSQKHRVVPLRQGEGTGFEIWRTVSDRKRVKVVDQIFPSREAAMAYMAANAQQIIETNTTFGEADLPRPENMKRIGDARRDGPVRDRDFIDTFGFRGVEFGNWNNQEERQQLLDDAYDGLLDLAEIMDIPPKAISLDGDLGLAFGARGQGLSGARAHYEPSKVVINLTKMNGAGSLAHEWFHALDHYLGRQDGKASAEWRQDKDGARSLKVSSSFEREAASAGFSRYGSGVREEVRQAYKDLMRTMTAKAEQYVEDTARADDFVGRARKEVADRLSQLRADLAEQKDPTYWKRNNKPASAEQLADFDTVAQQILEGVQLETELRTTKPDANVRRGRALSGMRWTNDALEQISSIYKSVRGRTGFNADSNGVLDRLRGTMGTYSSRLKMLAEAQSGAEKTKQVPTNFAMDAKELDQGRGTDYWTTPHEMAARAFQGYVEDRIADRGGSSPFLNYGPEAAVIPTPWGWKRPFPAGQERIAINASFDNFVGILQTRETETGGVAIYSRASYRRSPEQGQGARAGQLRLQIKRLTGAWQNAPEIKVVQSVKDLPERQRRTVERDGAFDVEGILSDSSVYLVADNLRDAKHAAFVLQHEVFGHAGLQGAYGQRLTPLLMSIYNGNADLKRQADDLVQQYGYTPAVAVEEVLADMAAAGTIQQQPFWSRLVTAMRNALRSIGMNLNWSEGDIQALLANARGYIVNGRRRPGVRDAFSRDGRSVRGPEITDEQGRLLAPNGKPSKLNQKQWHQVRSESFKRWFGDWQAVSVEERLDAMKPLKLKTPDAWRDMTAKQKQDAVRSALEVMAKRGDTLSHDHLGEVKVGSNALNKAASSAADPAKLAVLDRLRATFQHSIYASARPGEGERNRMTYHKLLAPIEIDGTPVVAVFTVQEDGNGRFFYNTVTLDGQNKAPVASPREVTREGQRSTSANTGAQTSTGAEVGSFVRRSLDRVNPDTVSKVTDGNGEPQVLYHGTAEQFTVFDQTRPGRSTGHATAPLGIFLTNDGTLAQAYAEKATDGMPGLANVLPLFASIKKPYRMSVAESQRLDTFEKAIEMRQRLEREGYDGIQLGNTGTWVAFYNNQVKSATNNTGAFDEVDPDIRYRRSGQGAVDLLDTFTDRFTNGKSTADAFPDLSQGSRDFLNKIGTPPAATRAREWLRERTERIATKIRQGVVDRYAALKELDEKLLGKDFVENSIHNSSWVLARMSSAASGAMNAMLLTGRLRFDRKERVIGLQEGDDSGGLVAVLSQLGSAAEVERFMGWIAANRADKLMQEGRENLFTAEEIASGKQLNSGRTTDGKSRQMLYSKVFNDFQQYRDDVLAIAEANGIVSPEARAMWRDEFYVPFYRVMDEEASASGPRAGKGLSRQEAYKKLKGGRQNLNDLLENTLMNFHHLLSASLKNQAATQVLVNAERAGIAREVPESRRDPKNSTFVLKGGDRVFYEVEDPLVFEALTALADPGLNNLAVRSMSAFKRLFTNMTTVTPQFILANTMRDLMQATATSPTSKNLFKNLAQGLGGYRDARTRAEMQASGGAFSFGHLYGADVDEVKASLQKAIKGSQLVTDPSMAPKILREGWRRWGEVADTAENISRAATYLQNVEQLGRLRAAYEARDIMDFSQHGSWPAIRFLIRVVPFLNARLQGLDKLYRSGVKPALLTAMGQGTASDKQAAARFGAVTGALTLASIALYLANADDDEYRKLEDWQKDSYWFIRIGDNAFFLPKPFEVGAIATMAERLTEQLVDDKATGELFADRLKDMMMQTFSFNPVPQMFQPLLDVYSNRDAFTGRDIETAGMERLSKGLRSRDSTTVAARAVSGVSRAFGDETPIALSPVQADHLIRGYFGAVGANAAGIVDTIWRGATGQEAPDKRWSEYQPIRRFYRDLGAPAPYTRYSTLFYEGLREANRIYSDVRELQGLGRADEAQEVVTEKRGILSMRQSLNRQQRRVSEINKQMEAVRRSDRDGAWKRKEIDRLTLMRSQITDQMGKQVEAVRVQ